MNIKQELDRWYESICTPAFVKDDPVFFPGRFKKREDVEIAAFLSAVIAWGRRDLILRSAQKMFSLMGESPYEFVMSGEWKKLKNRNVHRTFFEGDLKYFCRGFAYCYEKYGSLEVLFSGKDIDSKGRGASDIESQSLVWDGIDRFRREMAKANNGKYSKHISNPGKEGHGGSACKRLNLALRWLVRKDKVDLGLWKSISPRELFIPLDVHVARTARELGLLKRKSNDKKAVIELTGKLREFCPDDPVKYDFALFGKSVSS